MRACPGLGTLPSRMVGYLDEFERKGLLERRLRESDRRNNALHLTKAGQAAYRSTCRLAYEHQEALLGGTFKATAGAANGATTTRRQSTGPDLWRPSDVHRWRGHGDEDSKPWASFAGIKSAFYSQGCFSERMSITRCPKKRLIGHSHGRYQSTPELSATLTLALFQGCPLYAKNHVTDAKQYPNAICRYWPTRHLFICWEDVYLLGGWWR